MPRLNAPLKCPGDGRLLLCPAQTSGFERTVIEPVQSSRHLRPEQREMPDREQIFSDEPKRLIGGHPLEMIEAGHVYGIGKRAQGPLTAHIEIDLKVTERQFAKRTVNRLAVAAAGVVRFGYCPPMPVLLVNGNHMVGVMLSFKINHQRRISIYP